MMGRAVYCRCEQWEIIHLKNKSIKYQEHNHVSVYTIGLILCGQITLKCHEAFTTYSSGSYFIVAPYQVHALLLPDAYEMLSICVNKNLVESPTFAPANLSSVLSQALHQLGLNVNAVLLAKAAEALYICQAPQPSDRIILSSAHAFWRAPENHNRLQVTAGEAGYSLHHYIKKFKRHIGVTPHKFLLQSKIRKAQRMIENGKLFIDIALALGFYDQSHFIKCFKNIVGFTPSEYRGCVRRVYQKNIKETC